MNDSESSARIAPQEIRFVQRYFWEQCQYLGHPDHSPASVWLREHGLTNLDAGRFAFFLDKSLDKLGARVPFFLDDPPTEFQIPWSNRDEFLERLKELEQLNHAKSSSSTEG